MAANNNIIIENARLFFKDFSGEKNKFNSDRTFCVELSGDLPELLERDGWPVRYLEPRNEEEDRLAYLKVKVYFGKVPPQIIMISGGKKKPLNEENINILDWASFEKVDVQIRPYNYDFNGKTGVKAYLKSLWVTIKEDRLEEKYRDIPYATDGDANGDEFEPPFN